MKLSDIVQRLDLERLTPELMDKEATDIRGAHASDLLSDVLANAPQGGLVITIQAHLNTIAVALHARLSAVILAAGRVPEATVLSRAVDEGVPVYSTKKSTFDIAGELYALGLRGTAR